MNQYKFVVECEDASLIKRWLKAHNLPKTAKTVVQVKDKSEFVIEGNVSAIQLLVEFGTQGFNFKCTPVGNSQPLPPIYVAVG